MNWIMWAPWKRYKDAVEADGDLPEGVPAEEIIEAKNNRGTVIIETKARAPREFYISQKNANDHGYTRGCGGCSSWFRGLGRQPHTEEGRKRFEEAMKGEAKVVNAKRRMEEFVEKQKRQGRDAGGEAASSSKRKGDDIEEKEVEDAMEDGGLVWWQPKTNAKDEDMEPVAHPAKEDRKIGEVSSWDMFCGENEVGCGCVDWEYEGSARELLEEMEVWISEVKVSLGKEIMAEEWEVNDWCEKAWDDVHGKELRMEDGKAGRAEEIGYMKSRNI